MNVLAIDIGGKTRNAFCLMEMETKKILHHSYIPYDNKNTPMAHRYKILNEIKENYLSKYNVDIIVFEKINLFVKGNISRLSGITSLCKLQTTLIDNLSDIVDMYAIDVRSWKSRSLGSAKATKEDSIEAVKEYYPDIDLEIMVTKKNRKREERIEIELNHDLADAIMIAVAISIDDTLLKHKMNYT